MEDVRQVRSGTAVYIATVNVIARHAPRPAPTVNAPPEQRRPLAVTALMTSTFLVQPSLAHITTNANTRPPVPVNPQEAVGLWRQA